MIKLVLPELLAPISAVKFVVSIICDLYPNDLKLFIWSSEINIKIPLIFFVLCEYTSFPLTNLEYINLKRSSDSEFLYIFLIYKSLEKSRNPCF